MTEEDKNDGEEEKSINPFNWVGDVADAEFIKWAFMTFLLTIGEPDLLDGLIGLLLSAAGFLTSIT